MVLINFYGKFIMQSKITSSDIYLIQFDGFALIKY